MTIFKRVFILAALSSGTAASAEIVKVRPPTDNGIPFDAIFRSQIAERPCLNGDGRGTVLPLASFEYYCYLSVASRAELERFNLWPDPEYGTNSVIEGYYANEQVPSYLRPVHSSRKSMEYNPTPNFEGLAITVRLEGDYDDARFASACGKGKEGSDQCFALFLNEVRSLPLDGIKVDGMLRVKGPGCESNCRDGRYGGGTGGLPGSSTGG